MSVKNIGSIGGVTPFFDKTNSRIKGWVSIDGIVPVLDNSSLIKETLANCYSLGNKKGAGRVSLRALTKKGVSVGENKEARIPLNSEVDLTYLGINKRARNNSRSVIEAEKRILEDLLSNTRVAEDPMERVSNYKIETLREFNERDLTDIKKLFRNAYSRNGKIVMWYKPTKENIRKVLENSVVSVARNNERIISLAAAEKATIPSSIGNLDFYELSDAATIDSEENKGLIQACTYKNLEHIFENHPDLVYSEARASNIGATKSLLRVGFKYAGFLPKHVRIGGSRDINGIRGDIEDLNVLYKEVSR